MTFDEWWGTLETREQHRIDKEITKESFEAGRVAERERCAKIIETQDVDPAFKHRMVSTIRARSTK